MDTKKSMPVSSQDPSLSIIRQYIVPYLGAILLLLTASVLGWIQVEGINRQVIISFLTLFHPILLLLQLLMLIIAFSTDQLFSLLIIIGVELLVFIPWIVRQRMNSSKEEDRVSTLDEEIERFAENVTDLLMSQVQYDQLVGKLRKKINLFLQETKRTNQEELLVELQDQVAFVKEEVQQNITTTSQVLATAYRDYRSRLDNPENLATLSLVYDLLEQRIQFLKDQLQQDLQPIEQAIMVKSQQLQNDKDQQTLLEARERIIQAFDKVEKELQKLQNQIETMKSGEIDQVDEDELNELMLQQSGLFLQLTRIIPPRYSQKEQPEFDPRLLAVHKATSQLHKELRKIKSILHQREIELRTSELVLEFIKKGVADSEISVEQLAQYLGLETDLVRNVLVDIYNRYSEEGSFDSFTGIYHVNQPPH